MLAAALKNFVAVGAVAPAGNTYGTPTELAARLQLPDTSQATLGVLVIDVEVFCQRLRRAAAVLHVVDVAERFQPGGGPLEMSSGIVVVSTWLPPDGPVEDRARGGDEVERRGNRDGVGRLGPRSAVAGDCFAGEQKRVGGPDRVRQRDARGVAAVEGVLVGGGGDGGVDDRGAVTEVPGVVGDRACGVARSGRIEDRRHGLPGGYGGKNRGRRLVGDDRSAVRTAR